MELIENLYRIPSNGGKWCLYQIFRSIFIKNGILRTKSAIADYSLTTIASALPLPSTSAK
jgi:hypothetical protein